VILPSETFDYVATVPSSAADGVFECQTRCREEVPDRGSRHDNRLVGMTPTLSVTETQLPNADGTIEPWMRGQLTLVASPGDRRASAGTFSFCVDRMVTKLLLPGDAIHLVGGEDVGLSVFRQAELLLAVGAIVQMPLGRSIKVRHPSDLVEAAEAIYRQRDPTFEFLELPVEVGVGSQCCILYVGHQQLGGYEIYVEHGFRRAIPGIAAELGIWRSGLCHFKYITKSLSLMRRTVKAPSEAR